MSSGMMDTEPGGENTQYESIATHNQPHAKDAGQLGDRSAPTEAAELAAHEKTERGQATAENIRYGQTISEQGFGGQTTSSNGATSQSQYGNAKASSGQDELQQTRGEQGYGPGSDVGA
ncbi:hypothetical protein MMC25_006971 [Agyrium rufum]|nr:hypothetical protein [Agyrium rufum]